MLQPPNHQLDQNIFLNTCAYCNNTLFYVCVDVSGLIVIFDLGWYLLYREFDYR